MGRYLLAYDADCGPCTKFKRTIEFLDSHRRLGFVPLAKADSEGILDVIPTALRQRSFHLVTPDGNVSSGADALPTLVGLLPAGRFTSRLMVGAPGGRRAVRFVYETFSRLHGTGACSYRPGSGEFDAARRLQRPRSDDETSSGHQGFFGEMSVEARLPQG